VGEGGRSAAEVCVIVVVKLRLCLRSTISRRRGSRRQRREEEAEAHKGDIEKKFVSREEENAHLAWPGLADDACS